MEVLQDISTDISGKNILIVEDIIDTGKTLSFIQKNLKKRGAKSVENATLVNKSTRMVHEIKTPKYVCFDYESAPFLLGFGFDYQEKYRNLSGIYQMEEIDFL